MVQLEVKLRMKQQRGSEAEEKSGASCKGKMERRRERGVEPFTLSSDQRTEYRLETEEREKRGQ